MINSKKLVTNYILLFILILSTSLWVLNKYKENEVAFYLKNDLTLIENSYKTYIKKIESFSEVFFYNYIMGNQNIIKILKKDISRENKGEELYLAIKNKLNIFKKYNLQEINFYSPTGELLLKSEYKGIKENEKSKQYPLVEKSIEYLKIESTFDISSTSASYKYVRPLYNKQLELLAIVEITTNMPKLAFSITRNTNFETFFIFNKKALIEKLDNSFFDRFKNFIISNEYMYEKSIYNKNIENRLIEDDMEFIREKLKTKEKFALNYDGENHYSMIGFIPILNEITKQTIGYLVAMGENENYNTILNKYDLYNFFVVVLSLLFILMLYLIHYFYLKYKLFHTKFDSLYKSIDKYVVVAETDLYGFVTYVSQAFCKISGYKKEEILGRPINMLRSPDISKKFFDNMWKTILSGEVWEGEIKNTDKNGNSYWVRGNISPIKDSKGKITGYRSIRVNITDEKQLQKVNEILKRDLLIKLNEIKTRDTTEVDESKIRLMGQILDAFSNEWRKPISNISLSLMDLENKLADDKIDKDEITNIILKLTNENNHLSRELNDFKALFTNGNSQDRYNVYEVIKHSIASVYEKDIKIELTGDESLETYGVSYDFRKVILGIIHNSIEQIKLKGIIPGEISIRVEKDDKFVIVKCQDNALGIPNRLINKVFDLDFSTKDGISRNGITLHMAKLLIKKSDGDMWVKNENNGCCFYIKLITEDRRKGNRV